MMPIRKAFPKIRLDEETHTYYVSNAVFKSVSSRIEEVTPNFPAEHVAGAIAMKSEKTKEQILQEWALNNKQAITLGNSAHKFGEEYTKESIPQTTRDLGIKQWWEKLDDRYEVFALEHPIYSIKYELAGTPDILLRDKETDTIVICDYKTNKDLFKVKGRAKLTEPFSDFENTNFNKYTIQLNYYQFMLEQAGYDVSGRKIIWLKFDPKSLSFYTEYDVPLMTEKISWHEYDRSLEGDLCLEL